MINKLNQVAKKAYAEYSNFHVGSIFVLNDNQEFSGFNIENASYPLTMCAERVAIFSMMNKGVDVNKTKEVHIFSSDATQHLSPCGSCRQVMSEFLEPDVKIFMYKNNGEFIVKTFAEIMPLPVKKSVIEGK